MIMHIEKWGILKGLNEYQNSLQGFAKAALGAVSGLSFSHTHAAGLPIDFYIEYLQEEC